MPFAVEMIDITKTFPGVIANDRATLRVRQGEVHALVGENGSGKTTLMNILYGLIVPDSGTIRVKGREVRIRSAHDAIALGIGMVHQRFKLVPSLTVMQNICLGAEPRKAGIFIDHRREFEAVREMSARYGLEVDPRARVADCPVGVQQRVEILKALYREADILILDEPTAVLTPQEARGLFKVLRGLADKGKSVIFITHKLREVMEVSDTVTVMRLGRTVGSRPTAETNPRELARMMVGRDVALYVEGGIPGQVSGEARGRAPGGLPLRASGGAPGETSGGTSGGVSGEVSGRAAVGGFTGISAGVPGGRRPVRPDAAPVLEVEDLKVADSRGLLAVNGVSLTVRGGEILGIAGVEGNGQTELVEALAGLRPTLAGTVRLKGQDITAASPLRRRKAGMAHIPEDRMTRGLSLDDTVEDNLIAVAHNRFPLARLGLFRFAHRAEYADRLIEEFDLRAPGLRGVPGRRVRAGALSGGNLQKLVLARELAEAPDLILAAQPTRGVDIGSVEFIHRRLIEARNAGKAILLVSAELEEVMALSDRIAVMHKGRIVDVVPAETATEEEIGLLMAGVRREPEASVRTGETAESGSAETDRTRIALAESGGKGETGATRTGSFGSQRTENGAECTNEQHDQHHG